MWSPEGLLSEGCDFSVLAVVSVVMFGANNISAHRPNSIHRTKQCISEYTHIQDDICQRYIVWEEFFHRDGAKNQLRDGKCVINCKCAER